MNYEEGNWRIENMCSKKSTLKESYSHLLEMLLVVWFELTRDFQFRGDQCGLRSKHLGPSKNETLPLARTSALSRAFNHKTGNRAKNKHQHQSQLAFCENMFQCSKEHIYRNLELFPGLVFFAKFSMRFHF